MLDNSNVNLGKMGKLSRTNRDEHPVPVASDEAAALRALSQADLRQKTVFTTGEVAELCQISQQTVIRCFDSGRLRGFRVPGSKFRRVPRDALIAFMKANDIPLDRLDAAPGRVRVLVVDDDASILAMMHEVLKRDARFDVRTASTGYDAGLLTAEFRPHVVLLDYMLPDINGNQVCERIRANPELHDVKIILVSGVVRESEIQALLNAGADAFVKKPFDIHDLIEKMLQLTNAAT